MATFHDPDSVMVFRVRKYDIGIDDWRTSKRWATAAGAKLMGGEVIGKSGVQIDRSHLEPGMEWTALDFDPHTEKTAQFQTAIRP